MASTALLLSPRSEKFEEAQFMRDLVHLKDTQDAIQALSAWCLRNRKAAYKIARCWLKVIKKVKAEQKLVLFYLFNDVVQHSKRKNATELLSKCQGVLKEALPYLKEDKIGEDKTRRVQRVIQIWGERQVFEEKFIEDLAAILDDSKEDQEVIENFQPQQLCTQLKIMKALEDDTDYKHKTLKENELDIIDVEALKHNLKDRKHGNDFISDFEEGRRRMEQYIKALEREIAKRRNVVELLTQGGKYYESLMGEASIVATAYSNFGKRVRILREKLDEKMPALDRQQDLVSISPMPSPPDYDAPSPGEADEMELELPEDGQPPAIIVNEPVMPLGGGYSTTHHQRHSYGHEEHHHASSHRQQQHHHHHDHHHGRHGGGDLNSRLDSLMGSIPGATSNSSSASYPTDQGGGRGSITEYLTKLASGQSGPSSAPVAANNYTSNGNGSGKAGNAGWWPSDHWQQPPPPPPLQPEQPSLQEDWPPPHSEWPAPQPDPYDQQSEPVPEWQFHTEDEEPPAEDDEVYNENIALARLNKKSSVEKSSGAQNLISLTQPPTASQVPPHPRPSSTSAGAADRRSAEMDFSSDDDGGVQGHFPQQNDLRDVSGGGGGGRTNGQSHESGGGSSGRPTTSLQERLKNLAGVPASELDTGIKLGQRGGTGLPAPTPPRQSLPQQQNRFHAPPPSFEPHFEGRGMHHRPPPPMFGGANRGFARSPHPRGGGGGGGFVAGAPPPLPPGGYRGGRPPRGPRW